MLLMMRSLPCAGGGQYFKDTFFYSCLLVIEVAMVNGILVKLLKKLNSKHLKFYYVCGRRTFFFSIKLSCLLSDSSLFFPLKETAEFSEQKLHIEPKVLTHQVLSVLPSYYFPTFADMRLALPSARCASCLCTCPLRSPV